MKPIDKEALYWLWLASVTELSPIKKSRLAKAFGDPEALYEASPSQLRRIPRFTPDNIEKLEAHRSLEPVERMAEQLAKSKVSILPVTDPEYPQSLLELKDPPALLFARGRTELLNAPLRAGIVGSRSCTPYGSSQAEKFARVFSENGIAVVSGMAYGIDTAAHEGALRFRGSTVAVLGSGINVCYPPENRELFRRIARDGVVVTEYYPGEAALRYHFPQRNRIISGLSQCLLVIEARAKSGALITAGYALDEGKEVYAIPQNINTNRGSGSNELLKAGAHMATEPEDVIFGLCGDVRVRYEVKPGRNQVSPVPETAGRALSGTSYDTEREKTLTDLNRLVLTKIRDGAETPDELMEAAGLDISVMNLALSELELSGFIRIEFGRLYAL